MEISNKIKQNVKGKDGQIAKEQKASSCCLPICCGRSNENKKPERKEK